MAKDYIPLPDGGALAERKTCTCGASVTLFRGTWWNDNDTPHECGEAEG